MKNEVTVHVWHAADGRIVAVGRPAPDVADRAVPLCVDDSQGVVEVRVPEDQLSDLQETYRVDPAERKLVPLRS